MTNNKHTKKSKIKSLNESSLKSFISYSSPKQINELIETREDNNTTIGKIMSERGPLSLTKLPKRFNSISSKRISIPCHSSQKRNINDSHLQKTLTAEISLSSNYFNDSKVKRYNSSTLTSNKGLTNTIHDDVQELKLINSRLQNSILILKEKKKLMQTQLILKTKENEVSKLKYEKVINELKDELSKANGSNNAPSIKKKYDSYQKNSNNKQTKQDIIVKSLVCIIIEICELFFGDNSHYCRSNRSANKNIQIGAFNNSFQDPYNIEEETQSQLIDLILVLLIGKIEYINKTLGIRLNTEIDKLNQLRNANLTKTPLIDNTNNTCFIPISMNKKVHLRSASTLTDYSLNINSLLLPQSPKFCDEGLSRTLIKSKTINEVSQKDNSFIKRLFLAKTSSECQRGLFDTVPSKTVNNLNNNENNLKKNEANNEINILECSIGDLVSPSNEPFVHYTGNIDYFTLDGKSDDSN